MDWLLHLAFYIGGKLTLFLVPGGAVFSLASDLIPLLIFFLPLPVIIFHLAWQWVKVRCITTECAGTMRMSSIGSLYYSCDSCGRIKHSVIRRSPNTRG